MTAQHRKQQAEPGKVDTDTFADLKELRYGG